MSFNSFDFRKTLSRFATGVAVVLTHDSDDQLQGVTINSLTSVSLDPPLILFCLKSASARCALFQKSKRFSLNILAESQYDLAHHFAGREPENWEKIELYSTPEGDPRLQGCAAYLCCDLHTIIPGGDHKIFLCRVTGLESDGTKEPLIFYQSRFCAAQPLPLPLPNRQSLRNQKDGAVSNGSTIEPRGLPDKI
ncbi:MAG: flavin reductase family protein [Caedimonas sp.]|nr:flavin reductase family protein [Caedimonas sp.]